MARAEQIQTLGQYMGVLRRRWPYLAVIIPVVLLVSVLMAFTLPASYQSSATILLEESSIDPTLVKTTVVSYADQQIELVKRSVMTTDRLEEVVRQIDPYPDQPELTARQKADLIIMDTTIEKVDPVTLEPLVISSAFSIYYVNSSPSIAREVTARIAELFIEYNRAVRTSQAGDAYTFLLANSKALEKQMLELERRISEFKMKFGDSLPETLSRNENALDRLQRESDALEAEIRMVEQQESMLKLQLGQISPTLVTDKGGDAYTQLALLRTQLAEAQQKYTPDHPDVKRLTRAMQTLAEQAKLGNPVNVRPDNPEYLRVESELRAVNTNLAALRSNSARAKIQMSNYEQRLSQAPGVERDYVQLTREREIAQEQYSEIQAKLRNAEIAQGLESESKGERYTIIRKAYTPTEPYSPNRLGIVLLGIVLGGGLAVGAAAFRESADPTVRASHDIAEISVLPVLGAIPKLLNPVESRRQRVIVVSMVGAYLFATALVAVAIVMAG